MQIRADRTQSATVAIDDVPWVPSPSPGVDRRMLERVGEEVAKATSIVRYAPGSRFPTHVHDEGEEFLVLEGVFQDEHGDYPTGTYVRNPPGSAHAPFTTSGCTIFVKLRQMPDGDARVVIPPATTGSLHHDASRGVRVSRHHWTGAVELGTEGHELLLTSGTLTVDGTSHAAPHWIRVPAGSAVRLHADSAEVLQKSGHLEAWR